MMGPPEPVSLSAPPEIRVRPSIYDRATAAPCVTPSPLPPGVVVVHTVAELFAALDQIASHNAAQKGVP